MWPVFLMQWLHVLLSIFWFGSILYVDIVVIPTLMKLPPDQQRTFAIPLSLRSGRVLLPVSLLVLGRHKAHSYLEKRGTTWPPIPYHVIEQVLAEEGTS